MNRKNGIFLGFILSLIAFSSLITSCAECENCIQPRLDPFVDVSFFSYETRAAVRVNIDSINGRPSSEVVFGDTVLATYRFPLNMNDTTSIYYFSFTKFDEPEVKFYDTLALAYTLTPFQENEFIRLEASNLQILSHSFDSVSVNFRNQLRISNETTIRIFY
jgi:hypothetical protein